MEGNVYRISNVKRNFNDYYILWKIEIACNNKLFACERASSRLELVHHSFLYSFAREEKGRRREKKRTFFSIAFNPSHVSRPINFRPGFHSLKVKRERERDESISRHRRQKGAMTSRGHTQVSSAARIVARVLRSRMHFRAPDMHEARDSLADDPRLSLPNIFHRIDGQRDV